MAKESVVRELVRDAVVACEKASQAVAADMMPLIKAVNTRVVTSAIVALSGVSDKGTNLIAALDAAEKSAK